MNRKEIVFQCFLISTWFLGTMAVKFALPILPSIAEQFHVSTTLAKYNISLFLFGKAAGMLIFGPLSERYGRRLFMLLGLSIYTAGNLLAFIAPNIEMLLFSRLLQGIGVSSTLLMGRAMVNDLYKSSQAVTVFSHLFLGASVFISFLPILGSAIAIYFPWRFTFMIMAGYSGILFILCTHYLQETHSPQKSFELGFKKIAAYYRMILSHPFFLGYVACSLFMVAGEVAFNTASPFLLMKTFGVSKKIFGLLMTSLTLGHLAGTFVCGKLIKKYSLTHMMGMGVFTLAISGIMMSLLSLAGFSNLLSIMIPMTMFHIGTGFVMTVSAAGVVGPFPKLIGISLAASLLLKFTFSGLSSAIMSHLPTYHSNPVALMIAVCGVLSLLSWWLLIVPKGKAVIPAKAGI